MFLLIDFYSQTDYYWPFESTASLEGSLPVKKIGSNFTQILFPVGYSTKTSRHAVKTGDNSYLKIDFPSDVCVHHPDASSCPYGLTVSFVFKYDFRTSLLSSKKYMLLDTMGDQANALGYRVYVLRSSLGVTVRSRERTYQVWISSYNGGLFHHFVLTWSRNTGLKVYFNGQLRYSFDYFIFLQIRLVYSKV